MKRVKSSGKFVKMHIFCPISKYCASWILEWRSGNGLIIQMRMVPNHTWRTSPRPSSTRTPPRHASHFANSRIIIFTKYKDIEQYHLLQGIQSVSIQRYHSALPSSYPLLWIIKHWLFLITWNSCALSHANH